MTNLELVPWIRILFYEGAFLHEESQTDLSEVNSDTLSPDGLLLLGIGDLGLGCFHEAIIWGSKTHLIELADPYSAEVLSKRIFPKRLTELIEAEGTAVPDPSREALLFLRTLKDFKEHIHLVSRQNSQHSAVQLQQAPTLRASPYTRALSPSAVESYLECPQKFYLSRILKTEPEAEFDPERLDPRSKGKWIHLALENFFKEPNWNEPEKQILKFLIEGLELSFQDSHSAEYKAMLRSYALGVGVALTRYINTFEKTLQNIFSQRSFHTEFDVKASVFNTPFSGKIDRIDIVEGNKVLLWDFKTGRVPIYKKVPTLINNLKIQWFFYHEILHELGYQVIGGGYMNPIDSHNILLFLKDDNSAESHKLGSVFESFEYNFIKLDSPTLEDMRLSLKELTHKTKSGLEVGDFSPRPFKDSLCESCEQSALCGRPFLRVAAQ